MHRPVAGALCQVGQVVPVAASASAEPQVTVTVLEAASCRSRRGRRHAVLGELSLSGRALSAMCGRAARMVPLLKSRTHAMVEVQVTKAHTATSHVAPVAVGAPRGPMPCGATPRKASDATASVASDSSVSVIDATRPDAADVIRGLLSPMQHTCARRSVPMADAAAIPRGVGSQNDPRRAL